MELKSYQKQVIRDLSDYFDHLQQRKDAAKAFDSYWAGRIGAYNPFTGDGMRPYQDNVQSAVHLCIKVPTAGGKTFIACNALKTIFDAMSPDKAKAVVWLVPWGNLLDQTVKNLSDPEHPYCRKLNALFNNRVEVYEKKALLQGSNFNASVVQEQLSIMVLSYASIRASKKEDRKIFEQNGALISFATTNQSTTHVLEGSDETALINIIRNLNPVLIVDESHNAESPLSVDMLRNLNPSFILDLTATPKNNANIVSMVPAIELKKEHMVKLPVIVYNQQDRESVIESAIHLRKRLEDLAKEQEAKGGKYIRPIVLFQAQPKTKEDTSTTYEKLKKQLVTIGIPEEQIRIKTAEIDELKGIDLMDRNCPVRYVITINALKEGWDCPFAYILASLADRSSAVDVTQILGRVLRQPYVMKHSDPLLNLSYVITASAKFYDTLQHILEGLKESGYSEHDYRERDEMPEELKQVAEAEAPAAPSEALLFDTGRVSFAPSAEAIKTVQNIEAIAHTEHARVEKQVAETNDDSAFMQQLSEAGIHAKHYAMRQDVAELAKSIVLPKFVHFCPGLDLFEAEHDGLEPLERSILLKHFKLFEKDTSIVFDSISSELYRIDLEHTQNDEYKPSPFKIEDPGLQEQLHEYILSKPKESQVRDIAHQVILQINRIPAVPDHHLQRYITRILENMDALQLRDFLQHKLTYADRIKRKINLLMDEQAERQFTHDRESNLIRTKPLWHFPSHLFLSKTGPDIGRSLYTHEAEMNSLEQEFILKVAGLSNIAFWHRNLGRGKGFALNGFKADHYPDFIIVTKKRTIILAETKGDDRDNSDSEEKLQLGKAWSELSGSQTHKYFMVFRQQPFEGAYTINEAVEIIKGV